MGEANVVYGVHLLALCSKRFLLNNNQFTRVSMRLASGEREDQILGRNGRKAEKYTGHGEIVDMRGLQWPWWKE